MLGVCRMATRCLIEPTGGGLLIAELSVLDPDSESSVVPGVAVARPALARAAAAAASVENEEGEVVGSTSRWLAVLEKSRNEVGRMDEAATCATNPCRKQRAMGGATW